MNNEYPDDVGGPAVRQPNNKLVPSSRLRNPNPVLKTQIPTSKGPSLPPLVNKQTVSPGTSYERQQSVLPHQTRLPGIGKQEPSVGTKGPRTLFSGLPPPPQFNGHGGKKSKPKAKPKAKPKPKPKAKKPKVKR